MSRHGGYAAFSQELAEHVQRLHPNNSMIGRAMNAFSSTTDSTIISASEARKIIRHATCFEGEIEGLSWKSCRGEPFIFYFYSFSSVSLASVHINLERKKPCLYFLFVFQEYGLEDVAYTGFVRVTGYKSLISASDMSYAVTALLECNTQVVQGALDQKPFVDAFNVAYDALNPKSSASFKSKGFDLSTLVNGGDLSGPLASVLVFVWPFLCNS
jgi:hypothetical protein